MSLSFVDVHKSFRQGQTDIEVLRGVSLAVEPGESVAIVGRSGSGKSTVLALAAGLDSPTSGRITVDGAEMTALSERELTRFRAREIGMVFQQYHLMSELTALENISLPLELAGAADAVLRAQEALDRVGLSHRGRHFPRQLSGGECQRVSIARALVTRPKVLLADEPTGNLDPESARAVTTLLFDLSRTAGTTLILVTHSTELAANCARRLVLKDGRFA